LYEWAYDYIFSELQTSKKVHEKALSRLACITGQIPVFERDHRRLQPLICDKRSQVDKLESAIEVDREVETEVLYTLMLFSSERYTFTLLIQMHISHL
jgi:hypothetical protein